MATETPDYTLLGKDGKFEIRDYDPFVIAKTKVNSGYKEATYTGFRRVANYIFGGNKKQLSIEMTAPVISNVPNSDSAYEICFVMPQKHSLASLPEPKNDDVNLEKQHLGKTAVVSFGGWATESRVIYYKEQLEKFISIKQLSARGDFLVAQYNSPWVLPPFRKNEIIVKVE